MLLAGAIGYDPTMQRRAMEFHDSRILSMRRDGADLRIRVSAYIHVSEGEPGRDAGTGWIQEMDLVLSDVQVHSAPAQETGDISTGRVRVGDRTLENELPLPFDHAGEVRLELETLGGQLTVVATRLAALEIGEPRFVEDVPLLP